MKAKLHKMEEQKKQEQGSHSLTAEFVPYELAVKMKALGFDEPCFGWYENNELVTLLECIYPEDRLEFIKVGEISKRISAPTFSQVFRWFREKYNLYHSINIYNDKWLCIIKSTVSNEEHISGYVVDTINNGHPTFNTYEEAESACLDKLIELTFKSE